MSSSDPEKANFNIEDFEKYERSRSKLKNYISKVTKAKRSGLRISFDPQPIKDAIYESIKFKPSILKSDLIPSLLYFDKTSKNFEIYNCKSQEINRLQFPEMDQDISEFSYIEAAGDIFIIGGEIRSNSEGYLSYSRGTLALNENECRELSPMNNGR